jgi:fructokinase
MLNTAVSVGRLGLPVSLVSEIGDDLAGRFILDFLKANGVGTAHVGIARDGKTPLALAFLDRRRKAAYDFYRFPPSRRLPGPRPDFKTGDLVLFGSHFSLDGAVRRVLVPLIERARRAGAMILYDPNIRRRRPGLMPLVDRNLRLADIVKGSDDDFLALFGTANPDEIFARLRRRGVRRLILTRGPKAVVLRTEDHARSYAVKKVRVRSTIGAGDNFSAGVLSALHELGATRASLDRDACRSYGNFIGRALASKLRARTRPSGRG